MTTTPAGTSGKLGGWKATIAVSMSNYIEAGSIIALATSLTLWQEYFGFSNLVVGLVAAVSANAFGAAVGAMIGGPLGDRYGRKFIYTYDLILYMLGTLFVVFAVAPWMLVLGVVLTAAQAVVDASAVDPVAHLVVERVVGVLRESFVASSVTGMIWAGVVALVGVAGAVVRVRTVTYDSGHVHRG